MAALGGDETGALVADIGSWSARFGFAGDDVPKCVLGSCVGYDAAHDEAEVSAIAEVEKFIQETCEREDDLTKPEAFELKEAEDARPTAFALRDAMARRDALKRERRERRKRRWIHGDVASVGTRRVLDDGRHIVVKAPTNSEGELSDWDVVEALWREAERRLDSPLAEHPIFCAVPSWTTPKQQAQLVELLFETFDCPAAYLSRGASLAAFAAGRSSALVVDCGASGTSAVPVVDGYALLRAVKRSTLGGFALDDEFAIKLSSKLPPEKMVVAPREIGRRVRRAGLTGESATARLVSDVARLAVASPSLKAHSDRDVFRSLKESVCALPSPSKPPPSQQTLELPDGTAVDVDLDLRHLPERLFFVEPDASPKASETPAVASAAAPATSSSFQEQEASSPAANAKKEDTEQHGRSSYYGSPALTTFDVFPAPALEAIPTLVRGSLERCDVDIRKDLLQNVVLSGGGSLFPGMPDRLHRDLADHLAPTRLKTKVIAPSAIERQFAVWIGASILASLGSFQQLWLSRQEWDEDGAIGTFERWN